MAGLTYKFAQECFVKFSFSLRVFHSRVFSLTDKKEIEGKTFKTTF